MQILEIIIAGLLLILALWLFIRSVRTKGQGKCDGCAAKCPTRDLGTGCSNELLFIEKKK